MTSTTLTLRIEHRRETLSIGTSRPRLSWIIETSGRDWMQTAYQVEAYAPGGERRGQTGKINSSESVLLPWPFEPLTSRQRLKLRARVWGSDGKASQWSEPLWVEAGLLSPGDWSAQFITPAWNENPGQANPAPYLRRDFNLRPGFQSARLYITALGLYEACLNGQVVGDQALAPGWTVYTARLRYQTFDVTGLLQAGPNTLGAILGNGWFRGRLGFGGGRSNIYGTRLALLAQLEIQYPDGSIEQIVTDKQWQAGAGAILLNSLYDGETCDARLEPVGWSAPGFDASPWSAVQPVEWDFKTLEAPLGPPVRRTEMLAPAAITRSPSGKTLVDFGQNLVGWVALSVDGPAGQTITLRHAEVLENGELATRPLRFAKATDRFTLRGAGPETWEPRFTFHGFRYVEVTGWPGELQPQNLRAVVLHSDLERTGWFACSDPLLNQLHQNVVWGMRGNFVDVPTDCPQRDERLGWTGDLQVFAPTASFLFDVSGFLQSWLRDLAVEQRKANGAVPPVIPNILPSHFGAAAAWADAAVVVPWVVYQRFGDAQILADQFASLCAWVDYAAELAGPACLWDKGFQFGDWLDPSAPPDKPGQARTDKALVASAYFVHSADLAAQAAQVLGDAAAYEKYHALAQAARTAFGREYITPGGRLMSDAETAYALALVFDLLPTAAQRRRAGERLDELVRESGFHIRTGFVGTPLICDALCGAGYFRSAYRLLMQRECPSWLYPVTMGATTIWERWDSMLPDGSINPGEMTSFNHYALGAVADWLHRAIAGLAPNAPGYRRLEIRPRPGGGLSQAQARHLTPYGLAEVAWEIAEGKFHLSVTIPPNTCAQVFLPGVEQAVQVGSGGWDWTIPYHDPDARGPCTADDLVGDILSDERAAGAVRQVFEEAGMPEFLRAIILNERSISLRLALRMFANDERLASLLNERLAR